MLLVGVVAYSAVLAWARPPSSDAERKVRIRQMYESYARSFPDVPGIRAEDAMALVGSDDVVFVDVRERKEQEISMIPGAITESAYRADPGAYAGRKVVTYCTIGFRSGMFAKELAESGVDVHNLEGSLLAWTHARGPLASGGEPTRDLHVYGSRWNLAAEGYRGVW
jgi:sodium/bile acid cotransporter 7